MRAKGVEKTESFVEKQYLYYVKINLN